MLDYVEIDKRIRVRNPVELLNCDVTVHVNRFDEQGFALFSAAFKAAHESGQEIIPIVIDSFGGDVYSLLGMVDMIKGSDKKIATIATGKAMSAGAALLTCGDDGLRFASPNATIMLHDLSMGSCGKIEDVTADVNEGKRINKILFDLMENNCGLEKGTLLNMIREKYNGTDWFLNAKEAKKYKIVNYVKVPKFVTTVSVTTKLT